VTTGGVLNCKKNDFRTPEALKNLRIVLDNDDCLHQTGSHLAFCQVYFPEGKKLPVYHEIFPQIF